MSQETLSFCNIDRFIFSRSEDGKKVKCLWEEAFCHYDGNKKKTVLKGELPAATKEGNVLEDRAGQQATAAQLSDTFAIMDHDHPLAGKPLIVRHTILRVDDPS